MVMMAREPARWAWAGTVFGLGAGIAFLSKGVFVPGVLAISFLVQWILLPELHTRRTVFMLFVSALAASPFLFIWPWFLYAHDPHLFTVWFWDNNIGRFLGYTVDRLGAGNKPFYMIYTALWFAFPSIILAGVTGVMKRREWRSSEILIPASVGVIGLAL